MKKILLIEDNSDVRENVAEILELADYIVVTAENGKIGVELAKKEFPDLIICDVMMPELDGFGVLHVLSKSKDTSSIPFIFLTAKAEKDDMRKGMNLGADDYLTKPFDDVELLDAVEIRLKKNSILKEEFIKDTAGLENFITQATGLKEFENLLSDVTMNQLAPKKHTIYTVGSHPNFLYFITKGKVKTFKTDKLGNEFITGLHKQGDFLGYIDLLENSPYTETALALEDAEVCTVKRDVFFALIYNNRDVANKFIKMLSDSVFEREERLLKLAYQSVRKRVAEALIQLQEKYKQEGIEVFTMAISRDDLSGIVGASKETVIRTLTDFREEGLVQITGSRITLVKPDKLESMRN